MTSSSEMRHRAELGWQGSITELSVMVEISISMLSNTVATGYMWLLSRKVGRMPEELNFLFYLIWINLNVNNHT